MKQKKKVILFKKTHPITVIILGLLLISLGFNILQNQNINRLIYQIQKLEAGPARGLFLEPEIPKPPIDDKELKELMEQILRKMKNERTV
jgi:hypothetical protein